jgi:hypothetical protein
MAERNGKLDCIKYAHENGCPCEPETIYSAESSCNIECFIYALENGCPWDEKVVENKWYLDNIKYIQNRLNGYRDEILV